MCVAACMCAQAETRGECQASYSIILLFPLKQDFSLNPVLAILIRSVGQHTSRIRLSLPQAPLDVSNFYVGAGESNSGPQGLHSK